MKIKKHYFGKRQGVSRFGRNAAGNWAVPNLLRKYFINQQLRNFRDVSLKMEMNSSFGMPGKINISGISGMFGTIPKSQCKTDMVSHYIKELRERYPNMQIEFPPEIDLERPIDWEKVTGSLAKQLEVPVFTTSDSDFDEAGERKSLTELCGNRQPSTEYALSLAERKENKRRMQSGGF